MLVIKNGIQKFINIWSIYMINWDNLLKKTNIKKIMIMNWKKILLIGSVIIITVIYIIIIHNYIQKVNYTNSVITLKKRIYLIYINIQIWQFI